MTEIKRIGTLLAARPTTPQLETKAPSNFEHWVHLTAKLIGRSYIQTFKLVQDWPDHKIERRYKEAMNCNREFTTPEIRWWSLRKRDKASS